LDQIDLAINDSIGGLFGDYSAENSVLTVKAGWRRICWNAKCDIFQRLEAGAIGCWE